ncbi:MarR family transcriptional regulator [Mycolicibacterium sp.]|uniref:MarR family winged helix-turn-helix transcriptional regulator n=1 Tax=Mycolicibacterium sp. TaxID=2320850 RepID=UPI001DE7AB03|nr:MarR family transcriptional regulator [Mycolicibacterium sp.]MCB1291186.1 MarR family transcriptional regulator [Mycobacterium sp.]MCB9410228.1 MarR family transcriptional regulator [Mycolicibacterium sp.]
MADESSWLSPDAQRLWRHWLRLNALLPGVLHRELQSEAGISLPDYEVLVHLTDAPEERVRVTDLAREMNWERSRLSHHVTRMAGRGLVERTECHDDGRGAWVVLTERGRSAIEQAAPGHAATVRGLIFDDLTPEELETMTAVVDRVLARLGEPGPS